MPPSANFVFSRNDPWTFDKKEAKRRVRSEKAHVLDLISLSRPSSSLSPHIVYSSLYTAPLFKASKTPVNKRPLFFTKDDERCLLFHSTRLHGNFSDSSVYIIKQQRKKRVSKWKRKDEGNYILDIEKGKLKRQQHPYLLSNETDGGSGVLACSFIYCASDSVCGY